MANNYWTGSINNNWSDGGNWSEGLSPSLSDSVFFGISGNADCVLSEASSASFVSFDSYSGSFDMSGSELFVTDGITFDLDNNSSPIYDANINIFGGTLKIIDVGAGSSIDADVVIHGDITFFSSGDFVATSWLGSITPSASGQHTIIFDGEEGTSNDPIIYFFDEGGFLNRNCIITKNAHVSVFNPSLTGINEYYFGTESVILSGGQLDVRSDNFIIHFQTKIIIDALGGKINDGRASSSAIGQKYYGGVDLGGVFTLGSTGGYAGITDFFENLEGYAIKLLASAPQCKIISLNRSFRQISIEGPIIEEFGNTNPLILETNGSQREFFMNSRNDVTSGLIVQNTKSGYPGNQEGIVSFISIEDHPFGLGYLHIKGGAFRHDDAFGISGDFIFSENSTFFITNTNAGPLNVAGKVEISGGFNVTSLPTGNKNLIRNLFAPQEGFVRVYDGAIIEANNSFNLNTDDIKFSSPVTNVKFGDSDIIVTFDKFEIDSDENVLITFEGDMQLSGSPLLINNGVLGFESFSDSTAHELRFVAFNTEEDLNLVNIPITSGVLRFTNNTFAENSHGTSVINITGSEDIFPINTYFSQSYGDLTINATGMLRTQTNDFRFETQSGNTTEESSFTFNGNNLTMIALADFQNGFTFENNTTVTDSISANNVFTFNNSRLFTYYNFDTDYPSSANLNNKLVLNNTKIIATASGYDTFSGLYSFHEIDTEDGGFFIITGLSDSVNGSSSEISLRSQDQTNNNNDGRGAPEVPLMIGYKSFDKDYAPAPIVQDGTINSPIVVDENYDDVHNLQDPPSGVYKFFQVNGKLGYKIESYNTGDDPDTIFIIHEDNFDWKNVIDANEDRYNYGNNNVESEYVFPNNRTYYIRVTEYGLNNEDPNNLSNTDYGIRIVPFENPNRNNLDIYVGSNYDRGGGFFNRFHANDVNIEIVNNTSDQFSVTEDFVIGDNATFESLLGGTVMNISGSFDINGNLLFTNSGTIELNLNTDLNNRNNAFVNIEDVNCVNNKLNVVRAKNSGGNTNINFRRV